MQNYIKKFREIFARFKKSDSIYVRNGVRPSSDWQFILLVVFFVLVIGAVFASYFYVQVNEGGLFNIINEESFESGVTINRNLLQKTIDDINKREKIVNLVKTGLAIPSDPSI